MPSQFDALRNFKNGYTPNQLEDLKRYIPSCGYLACLSQHYTPLATLFNNPLEVALGHYQSNFNLSITRVLDRSILDTMRLKKQKLMDIVQPSSQPSSHGGKDYSPKKIMIMYNRIVIIYDLIHEQTCK